MIFVVLFDTKMDVGVDFVLDKNQEKTFVIGMSRDVPGSELLLSG